MRRLSGLVGYYRRLILNFNGAKAIPLHDLGMRRARFGESESAAVQQLKAALATGRGLRRAREQTLASLPLRGG